MVPNGWKLTSLGEVCSGSLQTGPFGSQLHAHEYTHEGVPVLMPKDLINYRANNESAAKIPEHRADDLKKHTLQSGDLLFSRRGDVARFALIESDYPRSLCGTGCLKATPNKAHSPLFLSYFLQKNAVKKWLEQNAVGQTMPNMNTAILAELPLMVASSREEEDKIAKILSTWDKAITTTEKLIETSKQQKKALMQQLLTGKKRLVNPDTGKAFEGEWEVHTFENYFDIGSSKRVLQSEWKDEGVPFYRTRELVSLAKREAFRSEIFISKELFDSLKEKYGIPTNGDLLVSGVGTLGISYLVGADDKFYFKDGNVLWFKNLGNIDSKFFDYCFHSDFVKNQILNQATITTVGTYTITNAKKTKFKCPLDKQEQQKIASVLTAADKEIEVLETKLAHFKQEKKALMQQLLTGKRRVSLSS